MGFKLLFRNFLINITKSIFNNIIFDDENNIVQVSKKHINYNKFKFRNKK